MSSLSSPPKLRSAQVLLILALFICAGLFTYKYSSIDVVDEAEVPVLTSLADPSSTQFVGRQFCIDCHGEENALWSDSHHDLAMQLANSDTVLGDFENTTFDYHGIPSTFYEKDGRYFVNTDGPDGKLRDYEIKYTFGVDPLQQYLIEFPGGRLQALGIAWDTRPVSEGGQRWFHLYPDEKINYRDELHWTRVSQNWNYMCAECHSTNLVKNYDIESNSYKTSWSEIDVSCEACHGPGSMHISWANNKDNDNYNDDPLMGFLKSLGDSSKGKWTFEGDSVIASRSKPFDATAQIETCARCHSRRSTLNNDEVYKKTLYDTHLISRLDENLYYSDGQINDEVYVYGSFLQSKMYRAGVACNDCHELHSLKLHSKGDNLCLRCHADSKYASEQHHFHELGTEGTRCIACHMPAKNYMV